MTIGTFTLRRFDRDGLRAYLDAVRPRYVIVRVVAGRVRLRWGFPLWAVEESVAFCLGAVRLLWAAWSHLPAGVRRRYPGVTRRLAPSETGGPDGLIPALYAACDEIAGGALRELLRLPPGVPYVSVALDDLTVEVTPY